MVESNITATNVIGVGILKAEHHLMFVVFTTFLVAFCAMYALEKVALDRTKVKAEPSLFVFYLHDVFQLKLKTHMLMDYHS